MAKAYTMLRVEHTADTEKGTTDPNLLVPEEERMCCLSGQGHCARTRSLNNTKLKDLAESGAQMLPTIQSEAP